MLVDIPIFPMVKKSDEAYFELLLAYGKNLFIFDPLFVHLGIKIFKTNKYI